MIWFEVKIKYRKTQDDGKEKMVSESYMIDAQFFTEAETRANEIIKDYIGCDFEIEAIKKHKGIDIVNCYEGDKWYKSSIDMIVHDDSTGREKSSNQTAYILADKINIALSRLESVASDWLIPYSIIGINLSNIVDVFPYKKRELTEEEILFNMKEEELKHLTKVNTVIRDIEELKKMKI